MTSEERFQTSTNPEPDAADDDDRAQEQDSTEAETNVSNTSAKPARRSRFFRSKRKQRLGGEQSNQSENPTTNNDNNEEESNVFVNSSESIEIPIQKPPDEEDSVENEIDTKPIPMPSTRRLTSPPPSPPAADDNDETDASTNSDEGQYSLQGEDLDAERQAYLTKKQHHVEESVFIEKKRPPPITFAGYQRKKAQSVKLTNADRISPNQKKEVRFADDYGLELSQIRVIKTDELPHVPSAAFKDLNVNYDDNATSFYQERMKVITYLEAQFENPIQAQGFDDRVGRHKVALEQANAIDNRIYGTVKIISFGVNKRVKVRFTTDNWISYRDNDATYIMDSYDGLHDRFTFTLDIDRDRICVGNNIQFCVGYESYVGPDYWDSNYQQNYRFDCVSRTIPDYSG